MPEEDTVMPPTKLRPTQVKAGLVLVPITAKNFSLSVFPCSLLNLPLRDHHHSFSGHLQLGVST